MISKENLLSSLSARSREDIHVIASSLRDAGFKCYLVGGCTRDLLLGRPAKDLDFTTDAIPTKVQKIFKRTVPTGIAHGTITVLLEDNAYEVTTFRSDGKYTDARRPDSVQFAKDLSSDLSRRDFTVNAIAFDPLTNELIDEHSGLDDLEKKILRTIGVPQERFFEDGLRTIRACRFASSLQFTIEPGTLNALSDPEVQKRTALVAVERFSDEILKGMSTEKPSIMIQHLEETSLLYLFISVSKKAENLKEIDSIRSPLNRLGVWMTDLFANQTENVLESNMHRLKLSGKIVRHVKWTGRILSHAKKTTELPEIRAFAALIRKDFHADSESFMHEFQEVSIAYPEVEWFIKRTLSAIKNDPLIATDLKIDGNDLKKLGLSGPAIGVAMNDLLKFVYADPNRNQKDTLLKHLEARK